MAWLGADVILVESARHPHTRATPPFSSPDRDPNTSAIFNTFNSAKRSLSIDMKTEEGQRLLAELVPHCDVVVENFRAGALDRIGLSYERLRDLRPDIVLLALGAFGRSGPMKDGAGLHSAANLYSGLADVTRYPAGSPRIMGACLPDPLSGLNAVAAVLLALQHRRRTGEGQFIDQAMYEGLLPWCADAIMADGPARADMRRLGTHGEASVLRGFFPAQGENEWIALQLDHLDDWRAACARLGLPGSLRDTDDPTSKDRLVLRAALTTWLSTRTADEAVRELRASGLAAGPARTTSGVLEDEQLRAFGFVRRLDHPVSGPHWLPTLPWRMEGIEESALRPAPLLGEHVTDVLGSLLGVAEDEIRELRERGILS
jgi:crotonobetainyl-CoA:carnitine CoA-transferase CaiB-like acyl-CoA transferase